MFFENNAIFNFPGSLTRAQDVLAVSGEMLLSSRFGDMLERRGWMGKSIIFLVALTLIVEVSGPRTKIRWSGRIPGRDGEIEHERPHDAFACVQCALRVLCNLLCAHRLNRQLLLLSMACFESVVLFCAAFGLLLASKVNRHLLLGPTGQYDVAWQVMDILYVVVNIPTFIFVSNLDCARLSRRTKMCMCVVIIVFAAHRFIVYRCFSTEWNEPIECFGGIWGISMREVALSGLQQICLFVSKALCAYWAGHAFSSLRSSYVLQDSSKASVECQTEGDLAEPAVQLTYADVAIVDGAVSPEEGGLPRVLPDKISL